MVSARVPSHFKRSLPFRGRCVDKCYADFLSRFYPNRSDLPHFTGVPDCVEKKEPKKCHLMF